MLKIAHIAPDEKFIESAVDIFETVYPGQNIFYITSSKPWTFLEEKPIYRQLNKKKWLKLLFTQRDELKDYDLVILHGLPSAFLIPMVLLKQNYVWLGWGFDYYSRPFDSDLLTVPLVLPKTMEYTKAFFDADSSNENRSSDVLTAIAKSLVKMVVCSKFFYQLAMRNLKVFSPVLPLEYDLVKEKYGLGKYTQYSPWNYGILERHIIKNMQLGEIDSANAILLGNSATATNNHLEALDILENSGSSRTIILPLSYGDKNYAKLINGYINSNPKLLNKCQVLDAFMPLAEYNAIINGCGFVIMNHVRQQALGNIVAMMYRGSKVFFREESVLYKYFKNMNAFVYSVQELKINPRLLDVHLNINEIEHNRLILKSIWSEDVIFQRTKDLVNSSIKPKR